MAKKKPSRADLKNRAQRKANQASSTTQAQIDTGIRRANDTYNTEVGASKGAARAVRQSIKGVRPGTLGLGGYTDDVRQELASRLDDTHGMVKFDKAQLKSDLRDQLLALKDQQTALDATEEADAQSILQDSIKNQREKALADREAATKHSRELEDALAEIRVQVAKARGDNPAALNAARKALKNTPGAKASLIDYLHTSQGISRKAAIEAAKIFIHRRSKTDAYDEAGYAASSWGSAMADQFGE